MKRAILLLVTAILGATGCNSRRCDTAITFLWHFPNASGTGELACNQAGVVNVEIIEDGSSDGVFACTLTDVNGNAVQGITLTNFAVRNYQFELDGLDASGNIIHRDQFSFTPTGCVDNQLDRTLPAVTGNLAIDFRFQDIGFTCTNAGTFMWYELLDRNNQVIDIVGPSNSPTALPCTSGAIALNQLAFGPYTVSRIQEVEPFNGNFANGFITHHATCTPQSFQHFVDGETVTVVVPASNGNCF
jgi:hypothetical protein